MPAPTFVIQNDVCACIEIIFLHGGILYVPAAFPLVNGVSAGMCACSDTKLGELHANVVMVDHIFPSLKKMLAWKF